MHSSVKFDTIMGRVKRGGYIFVWWIGDHPPPHVHILVNEKVIVKWDLESHKAISGNPSRRLLKLIEELVKDGRFKD